MSFEIYATPGMGGRAVDPGTCRVNANGRVAISFSDLSRVQIREEAVVLIDRDLQRIALRAPDAEAAEPTRDVKYGKSRASGGIRLAPAMRAAGVELSRQVGRRAVSFKDNLLIIELVTGRRG